MKAELIPNQRNPVSILDLRLKILDIEQRVRERFFDKQMTSRPRCSQCRVHMQRRRICNDGSLYSTRQR